jgi:hypothetical protein
MSKGLTNQLTYTAKDFEKEYKELCDRTGFQIVVNPAFVSTNHGSFEVVLQAGIGKMPKK